MAGNRIGYGPDRSITSATSIGQRASSSPSAGLRPSGSSIQGIAWRPWSSRQASNSRRRSGLLALRTDSVSGRACSYPASDRLLRAPLPFAAPELLGHEPPAVVLTGRRGQITAGEIAVRSAGGAAGELAVGALLLRQGDRHVRGRIASDAHSGPDACPAASRGDRESWARVSRQRIPPQPR